MNENINHHVRFKRLTIIGAGALLVAAAAYALQEQNYASMPPTLASIEARLESTSADFESAIANAELVLGGVAKSARMNIDRNVPMIEVMVYTAEMGHRVEVNPANGKVVDVHDMPRFPGEKADGELVPTASGLQYIDIEVGTGHPPTGPESRVKVHYTGYFVNGEKFDSSLDRNQPAEFSLGRVIKGWTEGVGSMREGGKRKLIIPFDLAYGEHGRQGIPPRATLIFDVELIEVLGE